MLSVSFAHASQLFVTNVVCGEMEMLFIHGTCCHDHSRYGAHLQAREVDLLSENYLVET